MLFRKTIEPRCAYCARGGTLEEGSVICAKKGFVSETDSCRHFIYDPLRRQPPEPEQVNLEKLENSDFSL